MAFISKKLLIAVLAVLVLVATIASAQTNCQVPNCQACSTTSEYTCVTCMSTYILNGGQCSPPTYCGVTNCNACVSGNPNRCATCNSGYAVTSSGLCGKKGKNGVSAPAAALWAAAVAGVVVYAL